MAVERCDPLCLDLPVADRLRAERLDPTFAEHRATRAAALADPTRLTLADALDRAGELCVCDLAWVAERSDNLVSHHVRRLRADGLVTARRDGKMVMYALTDPGRDLLHAVLSTPGTDEAAT